MIAVVIDGWRPSGLVAYLFGPGKFEEHVRPRVIASWDGAPQAHQPPKSGGGEFDFDLRSLISVMQELPKAAGLPLSTPPPTPDGLPDAALWSAWLRDAGKRKPPASAPAWVKQYRWDPTAGPDGAVVLKKGYVWHCPVRVHATDGTMSDAQWQMIAQRLMEATGLHQEGCRWIAVRHADDHIHLMATLLSDKGGVVKRIYPRNDFPKLRAECIKLERELGLVATAGIDRTARTRPTREEIYKAERLRGPGAEPARTVLHRLVSRAAAAAVDEDGFLSQLRNEGVSVRPNRAADGAIRGASFNLDGDVTAAGLPVWISGGKLAADLTWPSLQQRWASTPAAESVALTADGRSTVDARLQVLDEAAQIVAAAAVAVRSGQENPDGVAHGLGEVLTSLASAREGRGGGPLTEAITFYDRAARTPHEVVPRQLGSQARELRRASRRLAALGRVPGVGAERYALAALVLAIAGLIAEIRAWQAVARTHQAAAARQAHEVLPVDVSAAARGVRLRDRRRGVAVRTERSVVAPGTVSPASAPAHRRQRPPGRSPRGA